MHDLIIASSEYTTTNKLIVLVGPYANTGKDAQPSRRDAEPAPGCGARRIIK